MISLLVPISILRRGIQRLTSILFFRLLLILSGYFSVTLSATPLHDTYSIRENTDEPEGGDIILANLSSYAVLFFLQCKYSPLFAIPDGRGGIILKSCHQLLFQILASQNLSRGHSISFQQASSIACQENIPLVVFPEGAATNGRCVIRFKMFGSEVKKFDKKLFIYGIVASSRQFDPNFTMGNGFLHFLYQFGCPFSRMKIRVALQTDYMNPIDGLNDEMMNRYRFVLAGILRVPMVDKSSADFVSKVKQHSQ